MPLIIIPGARNALAALITLACAAPVSAALTEAVKLDNVTVFIRGAELFNSSKVTLPAGESEVIFTNIAADLNEQSLMVEADNGVVVQSTGLRHDFVSENLSPQVEELKKQVASAKQEKEKIDAQREVIQAQLAVLQDNRALGGKDAGVSSEQVNQMLQLVSSKMNELLMADIDLRQQLEEADKKFNNLSKQLEDAQQDVERAINQVVVKFYAEKPVTSDIKLSYVVNDAGWTPTYDVRVDNISKPVRLGYRADVYQNSGINWDKVHLTLSSGNPSEGAQAPVLTPWYIDLYKASALKKSAANYDERRAPVLPAPAPVATLAREIGSDQATMRKKSLSEYVITDAGGVNTRFSISLPYNIASDGKAYSVLIKQSEIQGNYRYLAIPRREQDAFLQVQLKDWEKLNLLPGKSNVFFEGSFVGQGYINPKEVRDTLDISLGRDKKILITREDTSLTTDKAEFFGSNSAKKYAYAIEAKNTRREPISLTVLDQIPLSRNSALMVEDIKHDNASYDKETGEVSWKLEMKPGESQKLGLSYTVKYPQNERVVGL